MRHCALLFLLLGSPTVQISLTKHYFDFFFFAGSSSSPSAFLFSEILLLFRVPSVGPFALLFGALSFLAAAPLDAPLVVSLSLSFFLLLLALGFCALAGASSSLSFCSSEDGLFASFSSCFSSDFFLPDDLGCGVPFFGSFLDPDSFSYEPPFFSYSLESFAA
jgi:hypothetical protein